MTKTINALTSTSSAAAGDFLPIWVTASGVTRKITKANFMGGVLSGGGTIATGGFTLTMTGTSSINAHVSGPGFTLTVPATGTAALLGTAQTFSALKTFSAGLKFGTDTLDYYEHQVAWTPVLADATSGGNVASVGTTYGHYTRMGKTVKLYGRFVNIDTTGMTGGNALTIRNLPFAVSSITANYTPIGACMLSNVTFSGVPVVFSNGGLDYLRIWVSTSAGAGASMLVSALTDDTADLYFELEYETDD